MIISKPSTLVHNLNITVLQGSPKENRRVWGFAWPPEQAEDTAVNRAEVSTGELWRVLWVGEGVESKVKKGNNKQGHVLDYKV